MSQYTSMSPAKLDDYLNYRSSCNEPDQQEQGAQNTSIFTERALPAASLPIAYVFPSLFQRRGIPKKLVKTHLILNIQMLGKCFKGWHAQTAQTASFRKRLDGKLLQNVWLDFRIVI